MSHYIPNQKCYHHRLHIWGHLPICYFYFIERPHQISMGDPIVPKCFLNRFDLRPESNVVFTMNDSLFVKGSLVLHASSQADHPQRCCDREYQADCLCQCGWREWLARSLDRPRRWYHATGGHADGNGSKCCGKQVPIGCCS